MKKNDKAEIIETEDTKPFDMLKKLYDISMEAVGDEIAVSPLGFRDVARMSESESLKAHGITMRDLRHPIKLLDILEDDSKFSAVMVALSKARDNFDELDAKNTNIRVIEAWVTAVMLESSGLVETKSEGN